jgi:hypothetical protein
MLRHDGGEVAPRRIAAYGKQPAIETERVSVFCDPFDRRDTVAAPRRQVMFRRQTIVDRNNRGAAPVCDGPTGPIRHVQASENKATAVNPNEYRQRRARASRLVNSNWNRSVGPWNGSISDTSDFLSRPRSRSRKAEIAPRCIHRHFVKVLRLIAEI